MRSSHFHRLSWLIGTHGLRIHRRRWRHMRPTLLLWPCLHGSGGRKEIRILPFIWSGVGLGHFRLLSAFPSRLSDVWCSGGVVVRFFLPFRFLDWFRFPFVHLLIRGERGWLRVRGVQLHSLARHRFRIAGWGVEHRNRSFGRGGKQGRGGAGRWRGRFSASIHRKGSG